MSTARSFVVGCCAAAIILLISASPIVRAAGPQPKAMHYQFKPGQQFAYAIKVEADLPDGKETLTGNSIYTVKLVDADTGQATLNNYGTFTTHKDPKPQNGVLRNPQMPSLLAGTQFGAVREIVIDPQGKVIRDDGDSQLPLLLGNLWQLVLEPLAANGQLTWDVKEPIQLSSKQGRGWGLPPFIGPAETKRSAQQNIHYAAGRPAGNEVLIAKKFDIATDEKTDAGPTLEQKGEGQITFDQKLGLIRLIDMKIGTSINQNNTTVRIPCTLDVQLLNAAETQNLIAERKKASDAARAKAEDDAKPKPITIGEINVALLELKDRDVFTVQHACERLAHAIPIDMRRKEVSAALEPLLNDREHFVRINAIKAMGVWGTRANLPALTAIANDSDHFVKEAAKDALVSITNGPNARPKAK